MNDDESLLAFALLLPYRSISFSYLPIDYQIENPRTTTTTKNVIKGKLSILFEIFVYNDVKEDRWKVEERGTYLIDSVKPEITYPTNLKREIPLLLSNLCHYEMSSRHRKESKWV